MSMIKRMTDKFSNLGLRHGNSSKQQSPTPTASPTTSLVSASLSRVLYSSDPRRGSIATQNTGTTQRTDSSTSAIRRDSTLDISMQNSTGNMLARQTSRPRGN